MGVVDTKGGSGEERPEERAEVAAQRSGRPRSSSILERLSGLLQRFGVVERRSPRGSAATSATAVLEADALRQRLTPPDGPVEELPIPVLSSQDRRAFALPPDTGSSAQPERHHASASLSESETDTSWSARQGHPEWKPILLVPGGAAAGNPSIEELADDDDESGESRSDSDV